MCGEYLRTAPVKTAHNTPDRTVVSHDINGRPFGKIPRFLIPVSRNQLKCFFLLCHSRIEKIHGYLWPFKWKPCAWYYPDQARANQNTQIFVKTTLPFNNYQHYSCTGLKSAKRLLRNINLELKHPRALTFYFANLASNSMKFLIHGISYHRLETLSTQLQYLRQD